MATDPYAAASANTNTSARAALDAIAQAGSAGKAQFDAAQQQVAAGKQAALGQAIGQANLIGGPEAHDPGFAATVAKPGDLSAANIAGLSNNYAQGLALMKANNANYMNQVQAALPLSKAYQDQKYAAAMAKVSPTDLQTNYLGAAQNKLADLTTQQQKALDAATAGQKDSQGQFDKANQQLTSDQALLASLQKGREVAKSGQKSVSFSLFGGSGAAGGFNPFGAGKVSIPTGLPQTKVTHEAYDPSTVQHVQNKVAQEQAQVAALQQALQQKTDAVNSTQNQKLPALSELARQQAINDGLNPNRAAGLFNSAFDAKNVKLSPDYAKASKDVTSLLGKGITRDQVLAAWGHDYGDNPALYNQLVSDYASSFPTTQKSALSQAASDARDLASLKKNNPAAYKQYLKDNAKAGS